MGLEKQVEECPVLKRTQGMDMGQIHILTWDISMT